MSQDFITRAELLAALNKVEDSAFAMWHGEHDSVKSAKGHVGFHSLAPRRGT